MTATHRSLKLPAPLAEAAALRAQQLGYASWSAYVKGLLTYDLMVQGPHSVTLPLSHLPLAKQDDIFEHLLKLTQRGEGERGQFLKRLLEQVDAPSLSAALLSTMP